MTSNLPPLGSEDFPEFFKAVHGRQPFPWQTRLATAVVRDGWPNVLDLPTGAGKTAVLDVAVFVLSVQAELSPRPSARRMVFVVDRRTIVDQAFDRARVIRSALSQPTHDVVERVRRRLASLSVDGRPLDVALLRGGIARGDGWARTPDQPLIAVSTVDQVGSRLLFRGYGVTDGMKPVHAGLLGHDVLYLLDEVHLSQPFRETLSAIAGRYRSWASSPLPGPFDVVQMSATPGSVEAGASFVLDDDDRRDSVLSQRLAASKPARLSMANARGFQAEMRRHAVSMLERPGATVAVVVNRVKTAREIHQQLSAMVDGVGGTACLLTGRMRPYDRDQLEQGVLARIRAGRTRSPEDRPIVVVATQSIEAGADFDFDGLVTECASLDALRQRFGRLDRLGELKGVARGVVVARADTLKDDPVYGEAIGKTWAWLEESASEGVIDFGIDAMRLPEAAEKDGLLSPRSHAPVLLPSHLDAWVQTSPAPAPDPEVSLWLHGPRSGAADVQVIWRADLSESLLLAAVDADADLVADASGLAIDIVGALRPGSPEAMQVPFVAAKRWLLGEPEPDSSDVEGAAEPDDSGGRSRERGRPVVLWRGEDSKVVLPADLRPGQTIIVPASYGGVSSGNWSPGSPDAVRDVAELALGTTRRHFVLRLHPDVLRDLTGTDGLGPPLPGPIEVEDLDDRGVVVDWLARLQQHELAPPLQELLRAMPSVRVLTVERLRSSTREDAPGDYFVVRWPIQPGGRPDADASREVEDGNSASFTGAEVTLVAHSEGVAEMVRALAERAGVPPAMKADLRLAAEWHDAGKADHRFQKWLHGGSEFKALAQSEPLAKSRVTLGMAARGEARERAGYPKGTRHELMSVALMDAASEGLMARARDRSLVWHLVASHHGYCRPLAPWVSDLAAVTVMFERDGVASQASSDHQLTRLDSGVTARFWEVVRTYGWWGAAWLEAVFRLADHRRSEQERGSRG